MRATKYIECRCFYKGVAPKPIKELTSQLDCIECKNAGQAHLPIILATRRKDTSDCEGAVVGSADASATKTAELAEVSRVTKVIKV